MTSDNALSSAQLLSNTNLKRISQAIARNTVDDSRDSIVIRVKQSKLTRTPSDNQLRTTSWEITRQLRWLPLGHGIFLTSDGHLAALLPKNEWKSEIPIGVYVSLSELSPKQAAAAAKTIGQLMTKYKLRLIL